jgi:hypothetical protein
VALADFFSILLERDVIRIEEQQYGMSNIPVVVTRHEEDVFFNR